MDNILNQPLRRLARKIRTNARWVLQVSWETCPGLISGLIIGKILNSAMPAALAWITRGLINAIVETSQQGLRDLTPIVPWLVYGLALVLINALLDFLTENLSRRLSDRMQVHMDMQTLEHSTRLDLSWLEDPDFQDIAQRAKQNTSGQIVGFLTEFFNLFSNSLKIIGIIIILFAIDPLIVLITVPTVLPYLWFKWRQSRARFTKEFRRATHRRWANYFSSVLTNRRYIPEIKLLRLAPLFLERYRELIRTFIDEDRHLHMRNLLGNFVFALVFSVFFYLLFARVAWLVLEGSLTVGDVAIFAGATKTLRDMLISLAGHVGKIMESTLFIENLIILLGIQPRICSGVGLTPERIRGRIEFRNVSFAYPGSRRTVLNNVSLTIEPGEIVALVGKNGAGKSTLVKLLCRLYDPVEGAILLDGIDLREISLDYLHQQIAVVFQQAAHFEASAADNIALGNWPGLSARRQVEEIGRLAQVDEMIRDMPDGYDTMLGRNFGEYDLSGGQWQRLVLARGLAKKDAPLLILDEPTRTLDAESEYQLFSEFDKIATGRTTLLISHRFTTINLARQIVVLDRGRVIETGTHQELLEKAGYYASYYELKERHRQLRGLMRL
ncbi:MAG: ABC transporter ATP-binding protein [Acidobacteria bacterium]|nr:ABC transporter ATP-binding protein [Acidobacteriota bacterium]